MSRILAVPFLRWRAMRCAREDVVAEHALKLISLEFGTAWPWAAAAVLLGAAGCGIALRRARRRAQRREPYGGLIIAVIGHADRGRTNLLEDALRAVIRERGGFSAPPWFWRHRGPDFCLQVIEHDTGPFVALRLEASVRVLGGGISPPGGNDP
jgi:hypothetical protein